VPSHLEKWADNRPLCHIDGITAEFTDSSVYVMSDLAAKLISLRFLAVNNNDDPTIAEGGSHWYFAITFTGIDGI